MTSSTLGVPAHLQPAPGNGDPQQACARRAAHSRPLARTTRLMLGGVIHLPSWIDPAVKMSQSGTPFEHRGPDDLAMMTLTVFGFQGDGWATANWPATCLDDWLSERDVAGISRYWRAGHDRRHPVRHSGNSRRTPLVRQPTVRLIDRGEGGTNLIVRVSVYQTTGAGSFSNAAPPAILNTNSHADIFSEWKHGLIPVGRTIRVNTATGQIEHT